MKRSHKFALMMGVSFLLMMAADVPVVMFVGRVLLLFSTLFHELGHALAALLVGGQLETMTIKWDASGGMLARIPNGRWAVAIMSAGGLLGPALTAAGLFWAARGSERRLRTVTVALGLALCLVGLLTAGSFWAILFTLGLGPALLFAAKRLERNPLEGVIVFIAVQLGISVFTRADYLFTKTAGVGLVSDVQQIAEQLWLPYWFWGLLCGGLSLAILYWGYRCYTRER